MLGDLVFWDERLEALFCAGLAARRRKLVTAFLLLRVVVLISLVIRAYFGEDWTRQDLQLLLGAACNIAPLLAVQRSLPSYLVSPLRYASVLADVVQTAIGCTNHHRVAPSRPGIGALAAVVYLPHGSTALWIYFNTAFSFLPFHLELLKAALVCTVLVGHSSSLCRRSPGLLTGYMAVHAAARAAFPAALDRLHAMGPLAVPQAAMVPVAGAAAALSAPPGKPAQQPAWSASFSGYHRLFWQTPCQLAQQCPLGAAGQDVCVQSQLVVLLLAFLGSTWAVHRTQLRARLHFLHSWCALGGSGPVPARAQLHQQGPAEAGYSRGPLPDQQHLVHQQEGQPGEDLSAAAAEELAEPLPNCADFLSLAVPAALCALIALNLPYPGSSLD